MDGLRTLEEYPHSAAGIRNRTLEEYPSHNVARALQLLTELGYSPIQAAGIVGNLIQESGPSLDTDIAGDQGTSHGIAQWRGDRFRALQQYAGNGDWRDLDTQIRFLDHELRTRETSAYGALQNAQNVDEATAAFIGFERPQGWTRDNPRGGHGYSRRLANAAQLAGQPIPTGTTASSAVGMPAAAAPLTPRDRLMAFGQDVAKGAGDTFKAMGIPPSSSPPLSGTLPATPVMEAKAAPIAETPPPREVRGLEVAAPMPSMGFGSGWVWENGRLVRKPADRRAAMAQALGGY